MPTRQEREDEAFYRRQRAKAGGKQRTSNNGKRIAADALDRLRREEYETLVASLLADEFVEPTIQFADQEDARR
jgi:hypothetical protein